MYYFVRQGFYMKFSNRQVDYILHTARHNVHDAIIKDGNIFIGDVVVMSDIKYQNLSVTYRGMPVDLSDDVKRYNRAMEIVQRAYNISYKRRRTRDFLQRLSDKFTRNYKLDTMTDLEIAAWFALDKIDRNMRKLKISRVGYMYNIRLGNTVLSHIPASEPDRIFLIIFNGNDIVNISSKHSNPYLYRRATEVFFTVYANVIQPAMKREHAQQGKVR